MHPLISLLICISLVHQNVVSAYFEDFYDVSSSSIKNFDDLDIQNDILSIANGSSTDASNFSQYRIEDKYIKASTVLLTNESFSQSEQTNSTFSSFPVHSNENSPNSHKVVTLSDNSDDESNSTSSNLNLSTSNTSAAKEVNYTMKTTNSILPTNQGVNGSSTAEDTEEPEGVVRGKPFSTGSINITTSQPETLYQKAWSLVNDRYILSILVPVVAGIVFASSIILTIATCRCLKMRCRRRRIHRKALPDSVRNMRPSDRARLLAESSDEEF